MSEHSLLPSLILQRLDAAGPAGTITPEDAARALAAALEQDWDPKAWHRFLSAARRAAIRLAEEGRIDILRKGKRVAPAGVKGVIRLRMAAMQAAP